MTSLDQEISASIEAGKNLPNLHMQVREALKRDPRTIVVLDDDPTGTQTVHGIPVITEWTVQAIENEIKASPVFFILTNSRSLQAKEAHALGKRIGERLRSAAKKHGKKLTVISRSDSTLRGHYPREVNALAGGLGWKKAKHILAPAFFEGGRYTYKDVHYVQEGGQFIPVARTPFAKDNTFGYVNSNLKDWIEEKSEGKISSDRVSSIGIDTLRNKPTAEILSTLTREENDHIVLNTTSLHDLQAFVLAYMEYEGHLIFRTGASFVNAVSGIAVRDCLNKNEILKDASNKGALLVIGSYVPKTTQQLEYLKERTNAIFVELDVTDVLDNNTFEKLLAGLAQKINQGIATGENVVLYTSRKVVKGRTKQESLEIVNKVSKGIIQIIKGLTHRPRYILAKGGITSSDVATKGLNVERALVLGQVIKGVPVWKLGGEAKFPGLPYIVFPGNVGDQRSIHQVITLLQ